MQEVEETVVNGNATPVGVGAITPPPEPSSGLPDPTALPLQTAPEDLKKLAHAHQIRTDLEAVGKRILMAMNRQAPCKIKYKELGSVLNALRVALR